MLINNTTHWGISTFKCPAEKNSFVLGAFQKSARGAIKLTSYGTLFHKVEAAHTKHWPTFMEETITRHRFLGPELELLFCVLFY